MTQLAYETIGDPSRPALMLVHGFLSSNAQWLLNRGPLSEHYHLIMLELWGHGASPLPSDVGANSVSGYLAQFELVREALGIDRWGVIGQSFGAGLAVRYALANPQRCTALIVTNSRSAFGNSSKQRRSGERGSRAQLGSARDLPMHPVNARHIPATVKHAMVAAADAVPLEALRNGGRLAPELHCTDVLGDLSMPMLLANGIFEQAFQAEAAALGDRYPQLEIANLQGGHSVNIQAADAFNAVVLDFLHRRIPAGGGGLS